MAIAIKLPDMGTTVDECKVLAWKVKEGDAVKRGDVLAEVETDKSVLDLESTATGIVLRCRVPAGATARTGEVLAYVGEAGETITDEASARTTDSAVERETDKRHAAISGATPATTAPPGSLPAPTAAHPAGISPIVRNLAAKLGVDLSRIQGTGAGGAITREDVQRAHRAAEREP